MTYIDRVSAWFRALVAVMVLDDGGGDCLLVLVLGEELDTRGRRGISRFWCVGAAIRTWNGKLLQGASERATAFLHDVYLLILDAALPNQCRGLVLVRDCGAA